MPVAFETLSTAQASDGGSTLTLPAPAGIVDGDILLAILQVRHGTAVYNGFAPGFTERGPAGLIGNNQTTWAVKLASSESGSYAFTVSVASPRRLGTMLRISGGLQSSDPFNIQDSVIVLDAVDPSTVLIPSIITTVDGCLIIWIATEEQGLGGNGPDRVLTGQTATERSDFTEINNQQSQAIYTRDVNPTAGVVGTATVTDAVSSAAPSGFAGIVIAIAPLLLPGGGGIMGGDNPSILAPSREKIERSQKILNPFGTKKRACMCPIGKCTCI